MSVTEFAIAYVAVSLGLFGGAILVVFIVAFIQGYSESRAERLAEFRLPRLKEHLATLLESGVGGSAVMCKEKDAHRFFTFRKVEADGGECAIELHFPGAEWAREYNPDVSSYCRHNAVPHQVEEGDTGSGRPPLTANCGGDVARAYDLGHAIWTRIFGLDPDSACTFDLTGFLPWGAPVREESESRSCDRDGRGSAKHQVTGLILIGLLLALAVATLLSVDSPAQWTYTLYGVTAAGDYASLVLVCLASLWAVVTAIVYARDKENKPKYSADPYLRALEKFSGYPLLATPIAVVVIWMGL